MNEADYDDDGNLKAGCCHPPETPALPPGSVQVVLTQRELTLIRVAMLQRLDRLKDRPDCQSTYNEIRDMMNVGGVLHAARFTDARTFAGQYSSTEVRDGKVFIKP